MYTILMGNADIARLLPPLKRTSGNVLPEMRSVFASVRVADFTRELFIMLFEIIFQGSGHRRAFLGRGFDRYFQPGIVCGFCRCRTERRHADTFVLAVSESAFECTYARRTEEHAHIIVECLNLFLRKIIAHGGRD